MKPCDIIEAYGGGEDHLALAYTFKGTKADRQIVYGEVYAPYIIDTHREMMLPEGIEKMAHDFLSSGVSSNFDVMHDNKVVEAKVIESFIARDGDPDYTPGAWVLGVKVEDADVWARIKSGELSGFSLEAMVIKREALVEILSFPNVFGFTEKADGHDHVYYVQLDEYGRVIGGTTSPGPDGHIHLIKAGTATEDASGHSHRFFLP